MQKKRNFPSILHYAKARVNFRRGARYGQVRGTVGSGLTPISPLGRRTSANLLLSGSRAGKLKMAQWFIFEFGAVSEQIRKNCPQFQTIHLRSVD